nr:E3 ubiquitin-protein ligase XIAP-like [Biomphalaria glabrata]
MCMKITLQMIKVKLTNVDQIIGSTYRLENLCHFHYDASRPRNAKACKNQICSFVKTAARKPLYSRYKDRLATITVTDARFIALAGYYYSTVQCLYICYYCGDAKQDLPATANLIIVQHIRSSPYCDYLRSRLSLSDCDVCMALDRNYTNFFSQKDYVKILKVQPDCDDRQDLLDEHTRLNICNLCHRNEVQCQLVCCGIVACESCIVGQRQCQYVPSNKIIIIR